MSRLSRIILVTQKEFYFENLICGLQSYKYGFREEGGGGGRVHSSKFAYAVNISNSNSKNISTVFIFVYNRYSKSYFLRSKILPDFIWKSNFC